MKESTAYVFRVENYIYKITTAKRYTRGPLKAAVPTALVKLQRNICSVSRFHSVVIKFTNHIRNNNYQPLLVSLQINYLPTLKSTRTNHELTSVQKNFGQRTNALPYILVWKWNAIFIHSYSRPVYATTANKSLYTEYYPDWGFSVLFPQL